MFEFSRSRTTQFLTYPPTKISSTRANHSHKQARQKKREKSGKEKHNKKESWTNDYWRKILVFFFFVFKGPIKYKIYFPETRLQLFEVILHYWWIKPKPSEPCVPFIFLSFVKKNTKGCFCKTWNVFSNWDRGKRRPSFRAFSAFLVENDFLFDYYYYYFFLINSWKSTNPETFEKKKNFFFHICGIFYFFLLLPIAHEYHILCCPLPNRITGSDFIWKKKAKERI